MATDKLVDFDHVTDYISREAAYKTLTEYYHHSSGVQHTVLREALNRVPTADVVEVVRCKDCIHAPLPGDCEGNDMEWPKIDGIYEDCTCPHCCADNWYSTRPDPDGFCEKGERREPNLDTTKGDSRD